MSVRADKENVHRKAPVVCALRRLQVNCAVDLQVSDAGSATLFMQHCVHAALGVEGSIDVAYGCQVRDDVGWVRVTAW